MPVGLDEANEQLKDMIAILKKQNQELQTQVCCARGRGRV